MILSRNLDTAFIYFVYRKTRRAAPHTRQKLISNGSKVDPQKPILGITAAI
jgi:hypothetical protein